MLEQISDDTHRDASLQPESGGSVAKIVEAQARNAELDTNLL